MPDRFAELAAALDGVAGRKRRRAGPEHAEVTAATLDGWAAAAAPPAPPPSSTAAPAPRLPDPWAPPPPHPPSRPAPALAPLPDRILCVLPEVALARALRAGELELGEGAAGPGASARTKLNGVANTRPGQAWLQHRAGLLHRRSAVGPGSAQTLLCLGAHQLWLGRPADALRTLSAAVERAETGAAAAEARHELAKAERQHRAAREQRRRASTLPPPAARLRALRTAVPVQRVEIGALSCAEFQARYARTSTPVILTGAGTAMSSKPWTLDWLREVAGSTRVALKRPDPGSIAWAGLEDAEDTTVGAFIDAVAAGSGGGPGASGTTRYLFDWSLPINAPELAEALTIPKFFAGDLLQRTPPGTKYRDSWPSLFVAPEGACSELHVDTFGSNFWMALFCGRKRWTFFDADALAPLYPNYRHATDPSFDVDLGDPDFEAFPLLETAQARTCELRPGELLFVPHGCPHRVENLTASVAVSGNFIDGSNINAALQELELAGLRDPEAARLHAALSALPRGPTVSLELPHTPFAAFKQPLGPR